MTVAITEARKFTFHPVLSQHQKHPESLQTPQRQNRVGSWPPKHSSRDRSSQTFSLTHSCFHCVPGYRRKPCSQEDTLCAERGLKRRPAGQVGNNIVKAIITPVRITRHISIILWQYIQIINKLLPSVLEQNHTVKSILDRSTAANILPPLVD